MATGRSHEVVVNCLLALHKSPCEHANKIYHNNGDIGEGLRLIDANKKYFDEHSECIALIALCQHYIS